MKGISKSSRKAQRPTKTEDRKKKEDSLTESKSESELESDEEESEEEEEEEEEEVEEVEEVQRKKKPRHCGFILEEAEEEDDDEEEEESEDEDQDIVEREELEGSSTLEEDSEQDCGPAWRLQNAGREESEEDLVSYFLNKYGATSDAAASSSELQEVPEEIAQQMRLPGVRDPRLWMVKCKFGEERDAALTLMRKCLAYQAKHQPLNIKSALAPHFLRGYIYVEAYQLRHVVEAIKGVPSLRPGCQQQQLVPMQEMPDVLQVSVQRAPALQPGCWVRIGVGFYKDDLAQVSSTDPRESSVCVKMIPRIDYRLLEAPGGQKDGWAKRKRFSRPPQALLNSGKIRSLGGKVSADGDFLCFQGNRYNRQGFLFKTFALSALNRVDVKPSISELQMFAEHPDALAHLQVLTEDSRDANSEHTLKPGDKVQVKDGELINLQGRVISVQDHRIIVMPKHEMLTQALEFSSHELQKDFAQGDHVKVISGRFRGTTGLVLRVEDTFVILFSDLTMEELKVLPRDLQLCSEASSTAPEASGQHCWGQLVQLDPGSVGIVVGLEGDTLRVLNTSGQVVTVRRQKVTPRKDNHRASGLDCEHNSLRVEDVVSVVDGKHSGVEARIVHLFRGVAFLHAKRLLDNGGLFVCKSRSLRLARPSQSPRGLCAGGSLAPSSPHLASPRHPSQGRHWEPAPAKWSAGGGPSEIQARGRGNRPRDTQLLGQSVRIIQGSYKGHIGILREVRQDTASVELHTTGQKILVLLERLVFIDNRRLGLQTPSSASTPMHGSQTPTCSSGSLTPLYGSETPKWESSYSPSFYGE